MSARTLLLVALVAAGLMALTATTGAQTTKRFHTKVVLTKGGPTGASGRVSCTTAGCPKTCKSKRKVKLYMVQDGPDRSFGTAWTDLSGAFRVNASLIQGLYYAEVFTKMLSGGDSCWMAVSARVHF